MNPIVKLRTEFLERFNSDEPFNSDEWSMLEQIWERNSGKMSEEFKYALDKNIYEVIGSMAYDVYYGYATTEIVIGDWAFLMDIQNSLAYMSRTAYPNIGR